MNIQIIGVTFGDPGLNAYWIEDQGFQYEVWTDDNRELAIHYGAAEDANAFIPDRITRLLDADGNVLLEYNSVSTSTSPAEVLEDCQKIFAD